MSKPRIALMSYAMDNRPAKGTALYTRRLIEGLVKDSNFEFFLVHYDKVNDSLYTKTNEILMPRVKLPWGSHFVSQMLFFWKYRKQKLDIIHWFQPRVYLFFWLAPAKKIVVTAHGAGDITAGDNTKFIFSRSAFNFVLKHFNRFKVKLVRVLARAKDLFIFGLPALVIWLALGRTKRAVDMFVIARKL